MIPVPIYYLLGFFRQPWKIKHAFTLAEVLITLGIIGIVAAITLPGLIARHQSAVLEKRFKKAYSVMSQVVQRVVWEDYNGNLSIGADITNELFTACNKRMSNSSVCLKKQAESCNTSIFPFASYESSAPLTNFVAATYHLELHTYKFLNDGMLAFSDGTFVIFDWGDGLGKYPITIDINGWKNKPNKGGVDLFMFELKSNGALVPIEEIGTLKRHDNCLSRPDVTCTYEALSNPDYFKKVNKN